MIDRIVFYPANESRFDAGIAQLLQSAYVEGGFTAAETAAKLFAIGEVKKRGEILLAIAGDGVVTGMVILGSEKNPYKQVAESGEAEMQLLATLPGHRHQGLGEALVAAFENQARGAGLTRAVLSTQPTMVAAHNLYKKLGYARNNQRDWRRADREFWAFEKTLVTL